MKKALKYIIRGMGSLTLRPVPKLHYRVTSKSEMPTKNVLAYFNTVEGYIANSVRDVYQRLDEPAKARITKRVVEQEPAE